MQPTIGMLTGPEVVIIGALIVLLFGVQQIPRLARAMGHAKRDFEAGMQDKIVDGAAESAPPDAKILGASSSPPERPPERTI